MIPNAPPDSLSITRPRKRKRPRALQACNVCRIRKNRCSEDRPCTYCVEHDLECNYTRAEPQALESDRLGVRPHQWEEAGLLIASSDLTASKPTVLGYENAQDSPQGITSPVQQYAKTLVERNDTGLRLSTSASINKSQHSPFTAPTRDSASDVMDTNLHTNNVEFYGSASSVAFLRHAEMLSNCQMPGSSTEMPELSLTSILHNTEFQPGNSPETAAGPAHDSDRYHFRIARRFLDAYFSNIHFIQPILDEDSFLTRCEDLWFNSESSHSLSFRALYYATLSLGSLVMSLDEPSFAGSTRFEWSRKLFHKSLALLTELGTTTDIEIVQCFYMLSKICQHELNPHVAYIYAGQAARTALSIGLNRNPTNVERRESGAMLAASQTWWAVYCLDIQTSLALGRPDSLGPDEYHTCQLPLPAISGTDRLDILHIVPSMVDLSRLMRQAALELYTRPNTLAQKLHKACSLDDRLQCWRSKVPPDLWPTYEENPEVSLKPKRVIGFLKKQSVVLRLRYLNLRMVIHAVFLIDPDEAKPEEATALLEARSRSVQAAEDAIDLIYNTFKADSFFQSWWFNCTYTLHAVSVLLAFVFRRLTRTASALQALFVQIEHAVSILQAMDDCLVARNATHIVKRALVRARKLPQPVIFQALQAQSSPPPLASNTLPLPRQNESVQQNGPMELFGPQDNGFDDGSADLEWFNAYPYDSSTQALFWTGWANELDVLGNSEQVK